MLENGSYNSAEDFLARVELGLFDGHLHEEVEKLNAEQLEEVVRLSMARYPIAEATEISVAQPKPTPM